MKHVKFKDIEPVIINNETARNVEGRLLIGSRDGADNFCMRSFTVGAGGHTPKHSHEWEHEIFVHEGSGEVFLGTEWQPVSAGSVVFIPGGAEHQFRNSSNAPFTFVCLIPSGPPEL